MVGCAAPVEGVAAMSERDPLDGLGFWIAVPIIGLIIISCFVLVVGGMVSILTSTGPCPWLP